MMDRIDIEESSELEVAEHDDTEELVPKRGARVCCLEGFLVSKRPTSTKQPFYASVVGLKLLSEAATQAICSITLAASMSWNIKNV